MFKILLLCAVIASALADVEVVKNTQDVRIDGFEKDLELSDGTKIEEKGVLKKVGDAEAIVQDGKFSFTSPEGENVQITYVADENGYQPSGDKLPTPPPIPEAIAKALEYIAQHPPKEN